MIVFAAGACYNTSSSKERRLMHMMKYMEQSTVKSDVDDLIYGGAGTVPSER